MTLLLLVLTSVTQQLCVGKSSPTCFLRPPGVHCCANATCAKMSNKSAKRLSSIFLLAMIGFIENQFESSRGFALGEITTSIYLLTTFCSQGLLLIMHLLFLLNRLISCPPSFSQTLYHQSGASGNGVEHLGNFGRLNKFWLAQLKTRIIFDYFEASGSHI